MYAPKVYLFFLTSTAFVAAKAIQMICLALLGVIFLLCKSDIALAGTSRSVLKLERMTQSADFVAVTYLPPESKRQCNTLHLADKEVCYTVQAYCRAVKSLPPGGRWHAKRDGRSPRDFRLALTLS